MRTQDEVFTKEFKEMMSARRAKNIEFNMNQLFIPKFTTMQSGAPKGTIALVQGVKEPYFEELNDSEVVILPRGSVEKRKVMGNGEFEKDKNGEYVTFSVAVPKDSVAVISSRNIRLKRIIKEGDTSRKHTPSQGYRYIDYKDTPMGRRFIYLIPKVHVYKLNLAALVITPNKRRVFYKGSQLALQNGTFIYMYVVPYSYRKSQDARVIGVKSSVDFDQEVNTILRSWIDLNILFDLGITQLADQVQGVTNLGLRPVLGTQLEDYERIGGNLQDDQEETFQEFVIQDID